MRPSNLDDIAAIVLKRYDYLRELVDSPQAKRELVESLETPRSTLDDIVRELEGAGLVEYRDGTWYPNSRAGWRVSSTPSTATGSPV